MPEIVPKPRDKEVVDFLNTNNINSLDTVSYKKAFRLVVIANVFFWSGTYYQRPGFRYGKRRGETESRNQRR